MQVKARRHHQRSRRRQEEEQGQREGQDQEPQVPQGSPSLEAAKMSKGDGEGAVRYRVNQEREVFQKPEEDSVFKEGVGTVSGATEHSRRRR